MKTKSKNPVQAPKISAGKTDPISVIVPENPFTPEPLKNVKHCLCALDVCRLMEWWPGLPHAPNRNLDKVKAIQRSLDWKRVAQIASYLLQEEIEDCAEVLNEVFAQIYDPRKNEPGREWPPSIRGSVKYATSSFPFFSNVLIHVNKASFKPSEDLFGTATIDLNPSVPGFLLSVIDGQHRINGAYLALKIRQQKMPTANFEIPAEVFLDLDPEGTRPKRQAQIFIDVNFYQKKVDRSLVADLFPLARENPDALDAKDRAQDIGRRLMLEKGPLVGMIQIPGIKYGVKDVVTLATLVGAVERIISPLNECDINNLEAQSAFLAQLLECWLDASGRSETGADVLDPQNVVYQGRVLVSVIDLIPAVLALLKKKKLSFISIKAKNEITEWLKGITENAGLLNAGQFINKKEFREKQFLGSGGIGRFRDILWAASAVEEPLGDLDADEIAASADAMRKKTARILGAHAS